VSTEEAVGRMDLRAALVKVRVNKRRGVAAGRIQLLWRASESEKSVDGGPSWG
jgi:hypothetical protein